MQNQDIVSTSSNRGEYVGEMDSEELEYTLLNPKTRNMVQLVSNDFNSTENLFEMLYGKNVNLRVKYIEQHAEGMEVDCE